MIVRNFLCLIVLGFAHFDNDQNVQRMNELTRRHIAALKTAAGNSNLQNMRTVCDLQRERRKCIVENFRDLLAIVPEDKLPLPIVRSCHDYWQQPSKGLDNLLLPWTNPTKYGKYSKESLRDLQYQEQETTRLWYNLCALYPSTSRIYMTRNANLA